VTKLFKNDEFTERITFSSMMKLHKDHLFKHDEITDDHLFKHDEIFNT
jgi:hypothetical protein